MLVSVPVGNGGQYEKKLNGVLSPTNTLGQEIPNRDNVPLLHLLKTL